MYEWRTGKHCIFKNTYHLVFVTKYRRGVFDDELLKHCEAVIKETCLQMDCELHEFNGEADHIHMLISIPPKHAVSNVVGKLKGKSAYSLKKHYLDRIKPYLWGHHFWSGSYCCVSVGGATLEVVKQYIEQQQRPVSEDTAKRSQRAAKPNRKQRPLTPT